MSSVDTLSTALQGLRLSQRAIDVVARNTSNASTPGYTRKILPSETVFAGQIASGARNGEVEREVDRSLQMDYWRQISRAGAAQARETYLDRAQRLSGTPEERISVAADFSRLTDSLTALAASPESDITLASTATKAQALATRLNQASDYATRLRNDVQNEMTQSVTAINESLRRLSQLNRLVIQEANLGRSIADLEDQRDQVVVELSRELDVSTFKRGDGALIVQTRTGRLLVDEEARTLQFSPGTLSELQAYPGSAAGVRIDDPVTGTDILAEIPGGRLGALADLRDRTLPSQQARLDEFAFRMAERFDAQGLRLFSDGAGALPGNDATQPAPAGYVGFARAIRANPAIVADPSLIRTGTGGGPAIVGVGDNTLIRNVLDFALGLESAPGVPHPPFAQTGLGIGGGQATSLTAVATLGQFAELIVARQAEDHAEAAREASTQTDYRDSIERRVLNFSGVDLDEELAKLIQLQQSYSASARLISTLEDLFQELLGALR